MTPENLQGPPVVAVETMEPDPNKVVLSANQPGIIGPMKESLPIRVQALLGLEVAYKFLDNEAHELHKLGHRRRAERIRKAVFAVRQAVNVLNTVPE